MTQRHPKICGHGAESMKLVAYAVIPKEKRKVHTDWSLAGKGPREIFGMAVCQESAGSVYVFMCDSAWNVMFDTFYLSLDDAELGPEFEYVETNEESKNETETP